MKNLITLLGTFGCSIFVSSQVGVNTTAPSATLDIVARNISATSVDGVIAPRIDRLKALNMSGVPNGTFVYINDISTGTATGQAANIDATGYYYFEGTAWKKFAGSGGSGSNIYNTDGTLTGNRNLNLGGNSLGFTGTGNVGIGTAAPNSDAILEASATNKGLLIPRVALTSTITTAPLASHTAGMFVYNTATAGISPNNVVPGIYYNDGTRWYLASQTSSNQSGASVNYQGFINASTPANSVIQLGNLQVRYNGTNTAGEISVRNMNNHPMYAYFFAVWGHTSGDGTQHGGSYTLQPNTWVKIYDYGFQNSEGNIIQFDTYDPSPEDGVTVKSYNLSTRMFYASEVGAAGDYMFMRFFRN
ncbi:hypothetical protein FW781_05500 (plasmid) [Chryseobacterium panacisoli]|uniref:C1q domain-containing protein n=1 Tax=Chryseobacterium panacisoli TaxID=1807141 RepID=A0A5D8ZXS8_9FLAO|nr:hypothetical protein [Chryseobacterium panacisoli]TZF99381.1 hypothetical protein FW781_05500 [Chryseobacterium panacisoli]